MALPADGAAVAIAESETSMEIEVLVPDIGDFDAVDVIDILVKPGDVVNAEDALITLESDKATMDIPSPRGGRVTAIGVKLGDKWIAKANLDVIPAS